jgi:DNA-binding response OmpR family regulator
MVVLTARTSEEDQMRGWGEGILEYLAKPFNPQRLVEWAEQAMQPRTTDDSDRRRERALEQLRLLKKLRQS